MENESKIRTLPRPGSKKEEAARGLLIASSHLASISSQTKSAHPNNARPTSREQIIIITSDLQTYYVTRDIKGERRRRRAFVIEESAGTITHAAPSPQTTLRLNRVSFAAALHCFSIALARLFVAIECRAGRSAESEIGSSGALEYTPEQIRVSSSSV